MPSFSAISFIATLALAAFTAAVPTAAPGDDLKARVVDLEARTSVPGATLLQGLIATVSSVTGTITSTSDVPTVSDGLTTVSTSIKGVSDQIKANPATVLQGLNTNDVVNLVGQVINLIGPCLTIVSGLTQGGTLSGSDCDLLNGLITLILTLLGELICLLVSLVPCLPLVTSLLALVGSGGLLSGLLATVISLVIGLITPVCGIILSGLLPVVTGSGLGSLLGIFGVAGSYPLALGGTLSILAFVTPVLTSCLSLLLGLVAV